MSTLTSILCSHLPEVRHQTGERLVRWGDEFAVILFDNGEIGQFATSGVWSRAEVEDAIRIWLRPSVELSER
jgi:hypothetical protein